jgi:molybdenum cofactor cytidylyltransferase
MASARIIGVLLAAGAGSRFGGGKLGAFLGGIMIGEHAARALAACQCDWHVAVCGDDDSPLASKLEALGFARIVNMQPEAGLSHSLALGVRHALHCEADAMLVCLGDMPFVPTEHLDRLLATFASTGRHACIASQNGQTRMPPAIFPKSRFPELMALTGDQGARPLLHEAIGVPTDPLHLADIDTQDDLVAHQGSA